MFSFDGVIMFPATTIAIGASGKGVVKSISPCYMFHFLEIDLNNDTIDKKMHRDLKSDKLVLLRAGIELTIIWFRLWHRPRLRVSPQETMMTSSNVKHFPRYWPFVWGIHRSLVNSPHKGQWRGALMFSLIRAWINGWVNNGGTGDLRRHRAHYDVTVMFTKIVAPTRTLLVPGLRQCVWSWLIHIMAQFPMPCWALG